MNFQQAEDYLAHLAKFGIKLGLEQTRKLMDDAGAPDRKLKFIHIAGTNGKGSCAAMLEGALRAAGFRTGLYTSPHLVSPCERIRVNGRAVGEEVYAGLVERLRPIAASYAECPTYFEFTTVMAALVFAEAGVDFVIWETGMGGRFDSTNVVMPVCSVITGIAMDHEKYLGGDLEAIAREKAGIIKPGRPVFCGELPPGAARVVEDTAARQGAALKYCAGDTAGNLKIHLDGATFSQSFDYAGRRIALGLAGSLQRRNFRVVFEVLAYLAEQYGFALERALDGLGTVRWPARVQFLPDGCILDGAHNPDGARALTEALAEILPGGKFTVIMANFADKDSRGILLELNKVAAGFIFVPLEVGGRNGLPPEELAALLREMTPTPSRTAASLAEALAMPSPDRKLIAGSLFLAGEALALYDGGASALNLE